LDDFTIPENLVKPKHLAIGSMNAEPKRYEKLRLAWSASANRGFLATIAFSRIENNSLFIGHPPVCSHGIFRNSLADLFHDAK